MSDLIDRAKELQENMFCRDRVLTDYGTMSLLIGRLAKLERENTALKKALKSDKRILAILNENSDNWANLAR